MTSSFFRDRHIREQLGGGGHGKFRSQQKTCNICGRRVRKLSEDHVPPKSLLEYLDLEIEQPVKSIIVTQENVTHHVTNNGIVFKTICEKCNNLLGRYDQELLRFSKAIADGLKVLNESPPETSSLISVRCKPSQVMRSLLGHTLSMRTNSANSVFDNEIRPCVNDESVVIPETAYIYYSIYPYTNVVVIPEIFAHSLRESDNGFCLYNMIKYYPLAFTITDSPMLDMLTNLNEYRNCNIDDEVDVPVDLDKILTPDKPEAWLQYAIVSPNCINATLIAKPRDPVKE